MTGADDAQATDGEATDGEARDGEVTDGDRVGAAAVGTGRSNLLTRLVTEPAARRLLLPALAGVLVVLLAVTGWQLWTLDQRDDVVLARAAATAAAGEHLEALLSYDAAALEDFRPRIDAATTGDFRDRFTRLFTETVQPNAVEQGAVTLAEVVASSWVSAEADRVVTLLFVNQSTTTQRTPAARIDTVQAEVTMQLVDGRWLIADLEQV